MNTVKNNNNEKTNLTPDEVIKIQMDYIHDLETELNDISANQEKQKNQVHLIKQKLICNENKLIRQKDEHDRKLALFLEKTRNSEIIAIKLAKVLGEIESKFNTSLTKAVISELETNCSVPTAVINAYYEGFNSK